MEQVKSSAVISSVEIGEKQQQQSSGSFVATSFGRRRHYWVCNDVWMDIFPHFDRPQLGLKLALISPRFDALVDTHFNGKSELTLWRNIAIRKDDVAVVSNFSLSIDHANSKAFPLPDRPLPNKIRVHLLYILHIDHSVISFLRSNQQIWDKGTDLTLCVFSPHDANVQPIWDVFVHQLWPIFATNIRRLAFPDGDHLDNLRRLTSPTILTDLVNLISIYSGALLPDVIGDDFDGPNATSAGQALFEWLQTPRKDGKPKRLCSHNNSVSPNVEWVNNLKKAFLRATATSSANYKIQFTIYPLPMSLVPFELVNDRTQEKLTLIKENQNKWGSRWIIKRCPIGETAAVHWEDENRNHLNTLSFLLFKQSIGPLSPPPADEEEAGQSIENEASSLMSD